MLGQTIVDVRGPSAPDPRLLLEVAIVRLARRESRTSLEALLDRVERLERTQGDGDRPANTGFSPGSPRFGRRSAGAGFDGTRSDHAAELAPHRGVGATWTPVLDIRTSPEGDATPGGGPHLAQRAAPSRPADPPRPVASAPVRPEAAAAPQPATATESSNAPSRSTT